MKHIDELKYARGLRERIKGMEVTQRGSPNR
jgi:hypothetical protein